MSPELIERWQERSHHRGEAFIVDGILDEELWAQAPRKVLFLLKEAYTQKPNGFDLRRHVRAGKRVAGPTWWRMGCWAYLLHHFDIARSPCFPAERSVMRSALLSSAVVNVKKSNGKNTSDMDDIVEYAKRDGDLLREQISNINPDIIVAGGTWAAVPLIWKDSRKTSHRFHQTSAGPLINFWHPAAQIHNDLLYYSLAGILQAAESKVAGSVPGRRNHLRFVTDTVPKLDPA